MRRTFSGYFPPTQVEFEELWVEGLIVIDANVLLNMYRYSTTTRQDLVTLFRRLQPRLWLPHQAAQEFLDGRVGVIETQMANCTKVLKDSDAMLGEVDSHRGYPFVTDALRERLGGTLEALRAEITSSIKELEGFISNDPVLTTVAEFFNERVGRPFTDEELKATVADGEERYKNELPPGFEDRRKPTEQRRYGDLIVWRQTLKEVAENKRPVIFVTDDAKEDWWWRPRGKTLGPHPFLKAEIVAITQKPFHMYRPDRFITEAFVRLDQKAEERTVNEVKAVQREVRKEAAKERKGRAFSRFVEMVEALGEPSPRRGEVQAAVAKLLEYVDQRGERGGANVDDARAAFRLLHQWAEGDEDTVASKVALRRRRQLLDTIRHILVTPNSSQKRVLENAISAVPPMPDTG
jgi:hypothetical protein